jgi:hypothetical protein
VNDAYTKYYVIRYAVMHALSFKIKIMNNYLVVDVGVGVRWMNIGHIYIQLSRDSQTDQQTDRGQTAEVSSNQLTDTPVFLLYYVYSVYFTFIIKYKRASLHRSRLR